MKGKGNRGETCWEAISEIINQAGKARRYSDILKLVKERGTWTDDHIAQELMSHLVNLPPARFHWKNIQPFLFLNADGTFEAYKAGKHPNVQE